jgi:hypothetical protein
VFSSDSIAQPSVFSSQPAAARDVLNAMPMSIASTNPSYYEAPSFVLARELSRLLAEIQPVDGSGINLVRIRYAGLRLTDSVVKIERGVTPRVYRRLSAIASDACETVAWGMTFIRDINAAPPEIEAAIQKIVARLRTLLAKEPEPAADGGAPARLDTTDQTGSHTTSSDSPEIEVNASAGSPTALRSEPYESGVGTALADQNADSVTLNEVRRSSG